MKLLWRNLLRHKLRTILTVVGLAVALFLFCFLETVLQAFHVGVNMADASRLIAMHKESITLTMPQSYRTLIQQVEGIKGVSYMTWFGGLFSEKTGAGELNEQFFGQFAVDFDTFLPIYPEIEMKPDEFKDLMKDQSGCVLGDKIAARLDKHVGDRIRLRSTIWPRPGENGEFWEFTVRAIYTSSSPNYDRTNMFFHYKYLDEGRQFGKGTVGIFTIGIDNPNRIKEISEAVDERFKNSPYETRTMTEKAFNMQFVSMMGNLELLLRSVGSAVILTMLLISANTMMMSGRERTREIGILKSIGFSDGYLFRLLIGEALLIAGLGALIGVGGSWVLVNHFHFNPKPDFFPVFIMPSAAAFVALLIAAVTGFLSGLVPAYSAARMDATEALRSV